MGGQQQAVDVRALAALVDRYALLVVGASAVLGGLPGTEAVYCASVDEAIVWLEGSRAWSAVVVGRSHPALHEAAAGVGVPVATLPAVDLPAFLREQASPIRSAHDLGRCGAALGALGPTAPAGDFTATAGRGDAGAEGATVGGQSEPAGSGPAPPGSGRGTRPAGQVSGGGPESEERATGAGRSSAGPASGTGSAGPTTAAGPESAGPATGDGPNSAEPATGDGPNSAGPATGDGPKSAGPARGAETGSATPGSAPGTESAGPAAAARPKSARPATRDGTSSAEAASGAETEAMPGGTPGSAAGVDGRAGPTAGSGRAEPGSPFRAADAETTPVGPGAAATVPPGGAAETPGTQTAAPQRTAGTKATARGTTEPEPATLSATAGTAEAPSSTGVGTTSPGPRGTERAPTARRSEKTGTTKEGERIWHVPDGATPMGGALVAVCGPGGTGASTVAMAVAAGLARRRPGVLLADLALRADQAVLHQVAATEAGLEALVHAHRIGRPTPEEVHAHTLRLDYHLLIGLRRRSLWTAIRPLDFDATLRSLRALFSVVVADVTGDLEGEATTGSVDLGERNHMARCSTASANVVVVVGGDGPTSRTGLDATIEAVRAHRGHSTGILTVRNGLWDGGGPAAMAGGNDAIVVGRFRPTADLAEWGRPVTDAVAALLDGGPLGGREPGPMPVSPGSIGQWQGAR